MGFADVKTIMGVVGVGYPRKEMAAELPGSHYRRKRSWCTALWPGSPSPPASIAHALCGRTHPVYKSKGTGCDIPGHPHDRFMSWGGWGRGSRKQDEKVILLEAWLVGAGVDIQFPDSCLISRCQLCFTRSH